MFRPNVSNGIWSPMVLTLALGVSIHSSTDTVATLLSLYCSIISLVIAVRIYFKSHSSGCDVSTILNDLIMDSHPRGNILSHDDLTPCFKISIFAPPCYLGAFHMFAPSEIGSKELSLLTLIFFYAYPTMLSKLFSSYPGSFSFGEGTIVMQATIIFIYKQMLDFIWLIEDETSRSGSIIITARVSLFIVMAWLLIANKYSKKFYLIGAVLIFGIYLPYLWLRLRRNLFVWIMIDMSHAKTIFLLVFWTLCVVAAVAYVYGYKKGGSNTIDRKVFHYLISFVFLSGIMFNPQLLYLASMVVLAIFLLVEFIRLHKVRPFGAHLDHYFKLFLDGKDSGPLILTNIYLLVGLSIPIWLSTTDNILVNATGVLAIGIGDSAASVIGSKFGRIPWSYGSKKTVEGSLASVLSQMFAICLLLGGSNSLRVGLCLSIVSALIEAFTDQVDNLITPLATHLVTVVLINFV